MPGKAERVDMNALAVVAIVCGSAIIAAGAIMLSTEVCDPEDIWLGCQPMRPYRTEGIALMFLGLSILILGAYAGMFRMGKRDTGPGAPCPTCGRPMTWVDQYDRWFCDVCEKYS